MTPVLVTGGAGYIGSHACKALAAAGYLPISVDSLVCGHREAVRWGPLECGDLLDAAWLDQIFAHWQPIAVMHFAAFAYVGESVQDPGKYYRNNVSGSLNLLQAMQRHGVEALVLSSSCATYGEARQLPMREDHPQLPINPYGASKLMVERMAHDFGRAHGLRSISLRYFNAAGADIDGEAGECHDPETHLIPLVLDAAAGKRPSVSIFGTDYPTDDGTCIRDYIHVSDIADAHLLALQALQRGANGNAFNLGNGGGYSVRQVIDCAGRVTGRPIIVNEKQRRAGDPPVLVSDASRIRGELGWSPRHPALETIIDSAWRWHQRSITVQTAANTE